MKYRKKPVIIDAVKWTGDNLKDIQDFLNNRWYDYDHKNGLFIWTLEGRMHASVGDFIIKGVAGEFYACKSDIFEATYEPLKEIKMSISHEMPKQYVDMVGTCQVFSGGLFSGRQDLPEREYMVHGIRWGSAIVINFEEMKDTGKSSYEHPTVEFLLFRSGMKRKQWSRGFPVREIDFTKIEGGDK